MTLNLQALRALYPAPKERALRKELNRLDPHCQRFIELSPFVVLASTGAAGPAARVGVVGLDDLPWSVAEPLFQAYPGAQLVDASALFAAVRQPADAAELGLARQALAKAQAALSGLDNVTAQHASAVTTTIE